MTDTLSSGISDRVVRFLAMAGVLAHYIADACMPLHNTKYHHGLVNASKKEQQVHNYIDNNILSAEKGELLRQAFSSIGSNPPFQRIDGGRDWGQRTMALLVYTYTRLHPKKIVETYNETLGWDWRRRYNHVIAEIGVPLRRCIARGTVRLAEIWENAWRQGGGNALADSSLVQVEKPDLSELYLDKDGFLPCRLLKDLTVNGTDRLVPK